MRQVQRRILPLLLALAMCLSLLPAAAMAAESCTVTFSAAGGKFPDGSDTQSIQTSPEGILPYTPDRPAKEGCSFVSWSGMSEEALKSRVFSSDETVTAVWESSPADIFYTVTFDANGGTFPDGTAAVDVQTKWLGAGSNITAAPPDPSREGYTFDGWDIDAVWNHNFTADTTVRAKWSRVPALVITFDPAGGTCAVKTMPLADGRLSGTLPTPVREGYTFLGWFRSGFETPVQSGEAFSAPETVTAKWSGDGAAEQTPVRIDFFPNGGRITQFSGRQIPPLTSGEPPYTVDAATGIDQNSGIGWTDTDGYGKLSSIPTAARDGYTFDGWYKLPDDMDFWSSVGGDYSREVFTDLSGPKLTTASVNAKSATYAAKWIKSAKTFTVTFHLNGASGTAPEPQKVEMGQTVNLPKLTASNAEFLGWGYSTDGRTLTEWKAAYTVTSDLTLYAMWKTEGSQVLRGLTYRFGNNHSAYGYAENYRIPKERYQLVFGKNQLASALYKNADIWRGSCFGMSTTAAMFYVDNDVEPADFDKDARLPYDLSAGDRNPDWSNMTVKEFIEAMQISQYGAGMRSGLSSLVAAVESSDRSGPVVIGITGPQGGHAVVGYAVESASKTQSRLMIYDPNYPNQEKYITLYKNGSDYTGWFYYLGKDSRGNDMNWGSDYRNGTIAYLPYRDFYQLRNSWAQNLSASQNLLFLNLENAVIKGQDGRTVATITDGEVSTTRSDVYPMTDYSMLLDSENDPHTGAAVWLPSNDIYTVTTAAKGMEATLVNVDQSAAVTTSSHSVTFAVNDGRALDYVRIGEAGASYDITLSSTLGQGHQEVQLTGTAASAGASLAQVSGSLYAAGLGGDAALKVDGRAAAASALSASMPDMESLLSGAAAKPAGANPFTDVKESAYYYDAVLWAVKNDVTSGTSATTFSPNASCTRGQIVAFLWRAAGSPKPSSSANPFTDVKEGAYYYDAVLWAVEKGITSGTSADTFSPNASCTRGQTVAFLWRAAGSPKPSSSANPFTDVKEGAYYYDAVLWAVEKGITSGTSADTFSPNATVTRAQTVTFLYRSQGK